MTFVATTRSCSPKERVELWREVSGATFVPLDVQELDDRPFHGEVRSVGVGATTFSDIRTSACVIERTSRLIRKSDPGYFKIEVQLAGSAIVEQGGRSVRLMPGDFVLYDTARPYRLAFPGKSRLMVLMMPRQALALPEGLSERITAVRVPGGSGLGRVAASTAAMLVEQLDAVEAAGDLRFSESVMGILRAALLADTATAEALSVSAHADVMRARIYAYVDEYLSDPDLCARQIADAQHISVRYLHKLIQSEDMTIAELIRFRRFERCRRDMQDPALESLSLSEIGARWGIPDPSTFSRGFRAFYRVSPSEYRRELAR